MRVAAGLAVPPLTSLAALLAVTALLPFAALVAFAALLTFALLLSFTALLALAALLCVPRLRLAGLLLRPLLGVSACVLPLLVGTRWGVRAVGDVLTVCRAPNRRVLLWPFVAFRRLDGFGRRVPLRRRLIGGLAR